jgi:hypothetical protein
MEKASLPLYKFNMSFPLYLVDHLENNTEEELREKIKKTMMYLMETKPESLVEWMTCEQEELTPDEFDELVNDESDERLHFSAEYVMFLRAMMDAGLVEKLKDEDKNGME